MWFSAPLHVLHKKAIGLPFLSDEIPRGSTKMSFSGPLAHGCGSLSVLGIFNSSRQAQDQVEIKHVLAHQHNTSQMSMLHR